MNKEQIERICMMEEAWKESALAVKHLLEVFPKIQELTAYYQSPQWLADFEDDENGKLPKDLPRGILSEDAADSLLAELQEIKALIENLQTFHS